MWKISRASGMVQLEELVPADVLYAKSHNAAIGKVWKEHHQLFADFLYQNMGEKGVLEIGGGNGVLNKYFIEKYKPIHWTIVEPSEVNVLAGCSAKYVKAFWQSPLDFSVMDTEFDTLVHTHLIEHQFDINEFLHLSNDVLKLGDKMVFSLPNMRACLENKYPYALNFEHTYLITEDYVDLLLEAYGFEVLEKKYFIDHSIFYSTRKNGKIKALQEVFLNKGQGLFELNQKLFNNYINGYVDRVEMLNRKISESDTSVYIFGAHINTQLLINFGLQVEKIKAVLDNDPNKQGHRLYGTKLKVESPRVLANEDKPMVILIMGAYVKEIQEDIIDNINKEAIFVL